MAERPTPVIICSTLTEKGAKTTMQVMSAGAVIYAQDEATCVVYGMPKEAVKQGAAMYEVALEQIPKLIADF